MLDRSPWPAVELIGAQPSGRSRPRQLAVRWGKEGGRHGDSTLPNTKAWEATRGWRTGGGALAWNGDDAGVVGNRRRRVGGVGSFTGGVAAFYRAEARRGVGVPSMVDVEGASMSHLEGTSY
jgi:hypothetical protein